MVSARLIDIRVPEHLNADQKMAYIRHMWRTLYAKDWEADRYGYLPVADRLALDSDLNAYAYRGFPKPQFALPMPGDEVWFAQYCTAFLGKVIGLDCEKHSYVIRPPNSPFDTVEVPYSLVFAEKLEALIQLFQQLTNKLICSGPPRDFTRVDGFKDIEFEAKRPPIRDAIRFVMSQLDRMGEFRSKYDDPQD